MITFRSTDTGSGFSETPDSMLSGSNDWMLSLRLRKVRFNAAQTPGSTSTSMASSTRKPPLARSRLPALIRVWSLSHSPSSPRAFSIVPNRLR